MLSFCALTGNKISSVVVSQFIFLTTSQNARKDEEACSDEEMQKTLGATKGLRGRSVCVSSITSNTNTK